MGSRLLLLGAVDGNLNGIYGESGKSSDDEGRDLLLFDLNDNGKFDGHSKDIAEMEILPIPRFIQTAEGFYQIHVAPDGSKVRVHRYDGAVQKVEVPGHRCSMMLESESGSLCVRSEEGAAELPVGDYETHYYQLRLKDKKGRDWTICARRDERRVRVEVKKEKASKLRLGTPLTAKATVRLNGNRANFDLKILDVNGYSVYDVQLGNHRPPVPSLRITRPDGKLVAVEKFHYG